MKIYSISDLHFSTSTNKPMDVFGGQWEGYEEKLKTNWKNTIAEDDIVLVAGDISWGMTLDEAKSDIDEISKLPGTKVIVKGNHDYWWHSISNVRSILPEKFFALQNDSLRFDNILLCGTRGWVVPEPNKTLSKEDEKVYKRELIRLELTLMHMEERRKDGDYVICMLHYPPFNKTRTSSEFTKLIEKHKVDRVVYGHVHGKKDNRGNESFVDGIRYSLTSCDQINNQPFLIYEP